MKTESDSSLELTPDKVVKVTAIVWGFFTLTMCFLFCAALVVLDGSAVITTPEREAFLRVFPLIGAAMLILSLVTNRLFRMAAARLAAAGEVRLMRYFGAVVASCALNESVVVLGFVLTLITKDAADIIPYFGLAVGANVLLFPTKDKLKRFFSA